MNEENIILIEISKIMVVNPRNRDKFTHNEIKENIYQIGLKRPVTVRRIIHDKFEYALICGQGRIEAYQHYQETHIPSIIKDVNEETGYLMSLAENIARRKPRATELLGSVRQLKDQGLTDKDISERLGYTTSWVQGVTALLGRGEKKLLAAFEAGHIPLYLAVEISRSSDETIQDSLTEALLNGSIKGRQINIIKRIIENRKKGNKGSTNNIYTSNKNQKKYTPDELTVIYQRNADEHKDIQVKAKYARETLMVVKEVFRNLTQDSVFLELLHTNNINDIPESLVHNR